MGGPRERGGGPRGRIAVRFVSTRGSAPPVTLSEALQRGLAPDGGLYVPQVFPRLDPDAISAGSSLAEVAAWSLAPFFAGDPLEPHLPAICRDAFDFEVPCVSAGDGMEVLELFHGPTAAFKDVGARFLAACFHRIPGARPLTILVATSGDTGSAVAAAFHGRDGIDVVVLYPKGMVSARQEKLLTVWGDNVRAFAVRGAFDDCQQMVKTVLSEAPDGFTFSSANSINLGRLLPQMTYYIRAALDHASRTGSAPGFVVPTGNLGNAVAAFWAREAGLPIRQIVLATNANRPLHEMASGQPFSAHPTVSTLATAMDVGNPSNYERLLHLLGSEDDIRRSAPVFSISDDEIRETIRSGEGKYGQTWEPHTATAVAARERLDGDNWIVVATAHPAKFETVVEPLVGHAVPVPEAMARMLDLPATFEEIDPDPAALLGRLNAPPLATTENR
jgi:threonine synthase